MPALRHLPEIPDFQHLLSSGHGRHLGKAKGGRRCAGCDAAHQVARFWTRFYRGIKPGVSQTPVFERSLLTTSRIPLRSPISGAAKNAAIACRAATASKTHNVRFWKLPHAQLKL
jgi:hypothetical protein